ncbi:MAG: alpha/beta fold hydrolase [Candidatus Hydrogenedentes bacterium]|nr:alpha/beta fold hydrolase [Candidatus Hydrogenedentota bacterium]
MAIVSADAPLYEDKQHLLEYKDAEGTRHSVEAIETWEIRRQDIIENFQRVAGPMPDASQQVPLDLRVEEETEFPGFIRKKITFAVEPGDRQPAYLLVPKGLNAAAPAMLCLHPTSPFGKGMVVGLGDKPNRNYAEELAQRGYVTLAPDYPGYGDYTDIDVYAMGYASATMKGIWNHLRCVDLLQSLPEVDGNRIGCIGHSLGGHNTLFAGMFDPRIKVMVTSCGFNRFAKYYGGDLTGWSHKGYMPRIAEMYGTDPAQMPFDFPEILGALAPRPVFINAPLGDENFEVSGVRDCVDAAKPVYALFDAVNHLQAVHPDCGHDFPPEIRERAYAFIDGALNP